MCDVIARVRVRTHAYPCSHRCIEVGLQVPPQDDTNMLMVLFFGGPDILFLIGQLHQVVMGASAFKGGGSVGADRDGTTSIVLLIGELLKQAERYLTEGCHPRTLVEVRSLPGALHLFGPRGNA